jgi:hypothetical protein
VRVRVGGCPSRRRSTCVVERREEERRVGLGHHERGQEDQTEERHLVRVRVGARVRARVRVGKTRAKSATGHQI